MIRKLLIQHLSDLESYLEENPVARLVAPSPKLADKYRERFLGQKIQTETISHFLKSLGEQASLEQEGEFKSKSELFMLLAAASKQGEGDKYHSFSRAFNLFTEIRSFSLKEEVLHSITEFYDAEVRDQVRLFHKLFLLFLRIQRS